MENCHYLLFKFVVFQMLFSGLCFSLENHEKEAIPFKMETLQCYMSGNLKVNIKCRYPHFDGESEFVRWVNEVVLENAKNTFVEWVKETSTEEITSEEFDQEAIDIAFDVREMCYQLTPVYFSPNFISLSGEIHSFSGLPHGGSKYLGFNYFWDGKRASVVKLDQTFDCTEEFERFLSRYSTQFFRENRMGYYCVDDEYSSAIDIRLEDCRVATLSEEGLVITFQPYKVGSWADGPFSVTVPFKDLAPFTRSDGPLGHLSQGLH